jgi:hypothetical protein
MGLKTLEEIMFNGGCSGHFKYRVRKEALKWVKSLNEINGENRDLPFLHKVNGDDIDAINSFCIHFFNLREEDLE